MTGNLGSADRRIVVRDLSVLRRCSRTHYNEPRPPPFLPPAGELVRRARERLGRGMTCVQFDKRGMGLSDRFEQPPTLEQRMDDMLCVLDAVGWERVNLLGVSEGGVMSQLFATEHPERVDRVVLLNTFASGRYRPRLRELQRESDPTLLPLDQLHATFVRHGEAWSEDPGVMVDFMMPSQSGNESFTRWAGRFQRFAGSPKDFFTQMESAFSIDGADAPERMTAPTLVMHVTGDRVLHVSNGRLLAELIPDSTYREIDGEDHYAWIMPNWREITDEMTSFVTGSTPTRSTTRQFSTILFTDIVDSTRESSNLGDAEWRNVLDSHDRITRDLVDATAAGSSRARATVCS